MAIVSTLAMGPALAQAVGLPSAADSSRIDQNTRRLPEPMPDVPATAAPRILPSAKAPEGAEKIRFKLRNVTVRNAENIPDVAIVDIYEPYIGHEVTLDLAWVWAGQITERYKNAGYFLSRAYVPQQSIEDGHLTLVAVAGYVHEIKTQGHGVESSLVQRWEEQVKAHKPLTSQQLESALLELNDMPGVKFRAVLEPTDDAQAAEGAVNMRLIGSKKAASGYVRTNNYGSRFLGPYQLEGQVSASLLPMQQTTLSGLVSLPTDELKNASLSHSLALEPGWTVDGYVARTGAQPGYTLKDQEIKSTSYTVGFGTSYQWIRQRDFNLSSRLAFEGRRTDADILGTALTRDDVRVARASLNIDGADGWNGYALANIAVTQGLSVFGSSKAGDLNLSREEAHPDFTKLNLTLSRIQGLGYGFQILTSMDGQLASGPLYSSEEFGYGGQAFGRGYDASEFTGDHGVAGALELRYTDLPVYEEITFTPYGFYDIGTVWNFDATQQPRTSGSSAGVGLTLQHALGIRANLTVAKPLTHDAEAPIYTTSGKAPRYMFELGYNF